MARKPSKPKQPKYEISLQLGAKTYSSSGETPAEALQKLPHPGKIMLKGVLTLRYDGKERTQLMYPVRLKRLFYNPTFQAIQAKALFVGMKPA